MNALSDSATPASIGFLSIVREPNGYVGGYLATNLWGRPLEFRLTSAVQPSRVQQILYGETLEPYVCGELIGKVLVEKSATKVQAVFTDHISALGLRLRLEIPVALVAAEGGVKRFQCHPHFAADQPLFAALRERLGALDLTEPFARIREAIVEARKLGIGGRGLGQAA